MGQGETIQLVGLGDVDAATLDWLAAELPKIFNEARVETGHASKRGGAGFASSTAPLPTRYYDRVRQQYEAEALLDSVPHPPADTRVLAVVNQDLYVPDLNFIFGLAQPHARRAIIQLPRLRETFYGRAKNEELFRARVLKEAVHELGHTFGLAHCPDPNCVMYFSKTLEDTDHKSPFFCENCAG